MVQDRKSVPENDDRTTPTRKTSLAGWVLAAIVVLLLVFGAISYFGNPNSPEENPGQSAPGGETQPGAADGAQ